jgi:chromatin segregation and condensation protein Rec8/ScpA/Scc1 (kleisin family)
MNKKQAARRFFTLLSNLNDYPYYKVTVIFIELLKHGKVKAKQRKPYRSIMVRVVGLHGEMDVSTAGEE